MRQFDCTVTDEKPFRLPLSACRRNPGASMSRDCAPDAARPELDVGVLRVWAGYPIGCRFGKIAQALYGQNFVSCPDCNPTGNRKPIKKRTTLRTSARILPGHRNHPLAFLGGKLVDCSIVHSSSFSLVGSSAIPEAVQSRCLEFIAAYDP